MRESWELLSDDDAERQCFASLAATLAMPGELAAPRNHWREVRRIEAPTGVCYLKIFHRTQLKNRLRFAVTGPRATCDAEREARVTRALRERGFETPRPIAVGRRGPSSFYLCAELQGTPLVELLRGHRCPPDLARQVAAHCGGLLCSGVILPDLSAEHVWLLDEAQRLAVLDLHNGYLSSRLGRRAAARVLKHFRRSVRGLAISQRTALSFATRLLKAAGRGGDIRAILRRVPPLDVHGKYESPTRAARYRERNPARTARELDLLRRVWPGHPGDLVLDAPCGVGRLTPLLMDELGVKLLAADRSRAMLVGDQTTGQKSPGSETAPDLTLQSDNLALPLADHAVDGVVSFRFLHHLPWDLGREALSETCRVARRYVVVSFFHPVSVHGLRRRLVELLTGKARTRHAVRLGAIREHMAGHGFRLARFGAERRYLRDFWLASFVTDAAQE